MRWAVFYFLSFIASFDGCRTQEAAAADGTTAGMNTEALLRYPSGDVRNCPTTSPVYRDEPLYRMEVLPGAGFDNLRNLDMGQVHSYTYSQCRISNDGRYLLPDNVFLIPTQRSHVEVFAEYFDHWDSYTSTNSY